MKKSEYTTYCLSRNIGRKLYRNGLHIFLPTLSRNILISVFLFFAFLFLPGCQSVYDKVGGDFDKNSELLEPLKFSSEAEKLIDFAFEGLNPPILDYHTHIVGLGKGDTGVWVNPKMRSYMHPMKLIQFKVYLSASGIRDIDHADQDYVKRLYNLSKQFKSKISHFVLAFDHHYTTSGEIDKEKSEFYVPNDYVFRLKQLAPENFIPAISINPYREDALQEITKWADKGVRLIKWLPNAMGIDPADKKLIPFYKKMKEKKMVLLSHTGDEKAVDGEEFQRFGDPRRLELPLKTGVKVIAAHLASLGKRDGKTNYEHFLELMKNESYKGLLYGEISAIIQYNRQEIIPDILKRQELHSRFVHGSDYPLPAVNFLIRLENLNKIGVLDEKDIEPLREIYAKNPLLFDFVLKRNLKDKSGNRFEASIFTRNLLQGE